MNGGAATTRKNAKNQPAEHRQNLRMQNIFTFSTCSSGEHEIESISGRIFRYLSVRFAFSACRRRIIPIFMIDNRQQSLATNVTAPAAVERSGIFHFNHVINKLRVQYNQ